MVVLGNSLSASRFLQSLFYQPLERVATVSIPSSYFAVLRALCEVIPVNVAFCAFGIALDKGFNHCM
ncbi:Uncharacterised protein [Candidatus Bartonella washoeensis]|uniref:Uncharacterized protein n=1 Tax=Candidatus Bartonella washoeensis Sb944nv TaxID=1094563 RepID=J0YUJ9_9HYPH|nr:hypothetical protein MCQ_01037 [Bartonella washoeensis Sb944nv]SPU27400.1 Uncharacterised protein [Bartonella washoeensis]